MLAKTQSAVLIKKKKKSSEPQSKLAVWILLMVLD